jgi:hypothetical protein
VSDLLQERYGRRATPRRTRLNLLIGALVAVAIAVAYIVWATLVRHPEVNWQVVSYNIQSPSRTTVTFEVSFNPRGHHSGPLRAICTVQALNEETTEVGRQDVTVTAGAHNRVQALATLPTSERATTGTVEECVLAS